MNNKGGLLIQKARENLKAAELLAQEGYCDIAAARAYYSMFYVAEALLLEKGLSFSSHSAVIAAFGKEYAKTGILDPKLHRYLMYALDVRQIGDYGVDVAIPMDKVVQILDWAREFIAAAEKYLGQ